MLLPFPCPSWLLTAAATDFPKELGAPPVLVGLSFPVAPPATGDAAPGNVLGPEPLLPGAEPLLPGAEPLLPGAEPLLPGAEPLLPAEPPDAAADGLPLPLPPPLSLCESGAATATPPVSKKPAAAKAAAFTGRYRRSTKGFPNL